METNLTKYSAMYWYDGIPNGSNTKFIKEHFLGCSFSHRDALVVPGDLLVGTYDGALFICDHKSARLQLIYQFPDGRPIRQIVVDKDIIGVLVEGNDFQQYYSSFYHIPNLKSRIKRSRHTKLVGKNVDHLFTPYTMLMNDSTSYGVFIPESGSVVPVRNLEYFEGENIYDQFGECLAINRYMATATVYTLNLKDFKSWNKDTFSFEGDFMSRVGEYLQEHPVYCDDPEEEMVEQEEIMNSMLPKSMVRSVHDKYTYLDFVKLYDSPWCDADNPRVVTGGRDHRIIITDFNYSHKIYFDKKFEDTPRCCCQGLNRIFIGCDNGTIVIIDNEYEYTEISLGVERFKRIEVDYLGEYMVAVNSDDMVFYIKVDSYDPDICCQMIENGVKDVLVAREKDGIHAYILTESGDLLQMEV